MDGLHVVFGGGGGAGGAVVRTLAGRGARVRAVTRSGLAGAPAGIEDLRADATDAAAAREACAGASVVYHCVNVPYERWEAVLPAVMANVVDGAAAAGARLVYCDNLYMYGPPRGPMAEDHPRAPSGPKGRLRARLEETLMDAHGSGRVRATIGRGSDFYGPGARNTVAGMLVLPAVVSGGKAHWLGSLDRPHSLHYIDDFAEGLVRLGAEEAALGRVWHLPAGPPVTGRAFIEEAFRVADRAPRLGVHRRWAIRLAGLFDARMRELTEILYQFEEPFVLDASKFVDAFGEPETTPLEDGLARSLAWQAAEATPA